MLQEWTGIMVSEQEKGLVDEGHRVDNGEVYGNLVQ